MGRVHLAHRVVHGSSHIETLLSWKIARHVEEGFGIPVTIQFFSQTPSSALHRVIMSRFCCQDEFASRCQNGQVLWPVHQGRA